MAAPGRRSESTGTVIVAGLANLAVAAAKAVAGLISGSAAVLSEAAHSLADTTTEILLYVALRRGARPADDQHPLGHGRESYLWALIAAVFTFVAGAGFSITEGVHSIQHPRHDQDAFVSYVVLVISAIAEGISLARATRQVRRRARRWRITPFRVLRRTPNTTVKAVFLEDSAAVIGLALAGAGVGLSDLTNSPFYDGAASIGIGILLLVVGGVLARSNLSLLIGQRAGDPARDEIVRELSALPEVRRIDSLLTLVLGPEDILIAAKVHFAHDATATEIAATAAEARRRLTARNPGVRFLFLEPSPSLPRPDPPAPGEPTAP
jgi:cation diffusion facilitator family transporter